MARSVGGSETAERTVPSAAAPTWARGGDAWGRPEEGTDAPGNDDDTLDDRWWIPLPAGGGAGGGPPGLGPPSGDQPSPARRPGALITALIGAVAIGLACLGMAFVLVSRFGPPGGTTPSPQLSLPEVSGIEAPTTANSVPRPTPSTPEVDASEIRTRVSPSVVEITSRIGDRGAAVGTGMVLTSSGEVLTNNHVIQGATAIRVQVNGTGPTYTATVLGYDVTADVALLQVQNASNLRPVTIGDSTAVSVGDRIVTIGNALGRPGPPTVTEGFVSGLNRSVTASDPGGLPETLTGLIQIDALLQPGDSGGPLVDAGSSVIGMNSAANTGARRSSAHIGFAIPIQTAVSIAHQIEAGRGSATVHIGERAILGVEVNASASEDGSTSGRGPSSGGRSGSGVLVTGVDPDGPASSAGMAAGDVLTSIGGRSLSSLSDLSSAMGAYHPGDRVTVRWVDQGNRNHTATLKLIAGPPA